MDAFASLAEKGRMGRQSWDVAHERGRGSEHPPKRKDSKPVPIHCILMSNTSGLRNRHHKKLKERVLRLR